MKQCGYLERRLRFGRYQLTNLTAVRMALGYGVKLLGDTVDYHGVKLDLSNPAIHTKLKSRFLIDIYEQQELELLDTYLNSDTAVIELGGCIGFTACYTAQRIDAPHLVVEANEDLVPTIEKNKQLNNVDFTVVPKAYHSTQDEVIFYKHPRFVGGSVQRETDVAVTAPAVSLEDLRKEHGYDTYQLIVDIEGGEFDLIDHELEQLQDYCSQLIIEFHEFGGNVPEAVAQLEDAGFEIVDASSMVYVFQNSLQGETGDGDEGG